MIADDLKPMTKEMVNNINVKIVRELLESFEKNPKDEVNSFLIFIMSQFYMQFWEDAKTALEHQDEFLFSEVLSVAADSLRRTVYQIELAKLNSKKEVTLQ